MQEPETQSVYLFDKPSKRWGPIALPAQKAEQLVPASVPASEDINILTWNVDSFRDYPRRRFAKVLEYIETLFPSGATLPLILIQELDQTCFTVLKAHTYVQENFLLTDLSEKAWPNYVAYGTVAMCPRFLLDRILAVFRVTFNSTMGRDGLIIDLSYDRDSSRSFSGRLRIANVHLESLREPGLRMRPKQLKCVLDSLTADGVDCGIIAGDMNSITPEDKTLPESLGLEDTWAKQIRLQKDSDSSDGEGSFCSMNEIDEDTSGHTWGYQPKTRFAPGRLDKILTIGNVPVSDIKRIGVDLKVAIASGWEEEEPDAYDSNEAIIWVSDHYGLQGTIKWSALRTDS